MIQFIVIKIIYNSTSVLKAELYNIIRILINKPKCMCKMGEYDVFCKKIAIIVV
jgi:hypothetical protein